MREREGARVLGISGIGGSVPPNTLVMPVIQMNPMIGNRTTQPTTSGISDAFAAVGPERPGAELLVAAGGRNSPR